MLLQVERHSSILTGSLARGKFVLRKAFHSFCEGVEEPGKYERFCVDRERRTNWRSDGQKAFSIFLFHSLLPVTLMAVIGQSLNVIVTIRELKSHSKKVGGRDGKEGQLKIQSKPVN